MLTRSKGQAEFSPGPELLNNIRRRKRQELASQDMDQEASPPPPPQDDRFLDYYEATFEEAPEVFDDYLNSNRNKL